MCADVKYQPSKKIKMNSSFDNIIKSEKPVLIDFLLLGADLAVLGPILKEVKDNLGDGISIIKSMSIKPRNSIQVSGARCSHNDSFQKGNSCGENQVF
jgi:hypothetical protein